MDDACGKHGQQEGDTDADTNSEFVPTANTISAMEALTLQNQVQVHFRDAQVFGGGLASPLERG